MPTGWQGSNRRRTLPTNWSEEIAPRILRRDGHRCRHIREDTGRPCMRPARDVDHIVPYHQGGTDDDRNLQALCPWHHGRKSGREGGIASGKARRAKRQAAAPIHPGLSATPVHERRDNPAPF